MSSIVTQAQNTTNNYTNNYTKIKENFKLYKTKLPILRKKIYDAQIELNQHHIRGAFNDLKFHISQSKRDKRYKVRHKFLHSEPYTISDHQLLTQRATRLIQYKKAAKQAYEYIKVFEIEEKCLSRET